MIPNLMKSKLLLLFLLVLQAGFGQVYDSKYAVFDRKVVLVKGITESSELVCVVPKGNPVRILEKMRGPVYKARYKDWNGYLISFNLQNKFAKNQDKLVSHRSLSSTPGNTYLTLSRKTYITNKSDHKMIVSVKKGERVQVIRRVKKGKYLVRYKNYIGFCDLRRYAGKDDSMQRFVNEMEVQKSHGKNRFADRLPPIINVVDVSLSQNKISAGESNQLRITLRNSGLGDAENVYIRLSSSDSDLEFPEFSPFPKIEANGGSVTLKLPIDGSLQMQDGMSSLGIEIVEPDFNVKVPTRTLRFETRDLPRPELVIGNYKVEEIRSELPDGRIDVNELVELNFTIRNLGAKGTEALDVEVLSDQEGVVLLGFVRNGKIVRKHPRFTGLEPGAQREITYRYFLNSEFIDEELRFRVRASDPVTDNGFSAALTFPLETGPFLDSYQIVGSGMETGNEIGRNERISPIFNVDEGIPVSRSKQVNTYVLIVGNEDYRSRQTDLSVQQNALFALNDANVFRAYCERTLGIPKRQIKILRNATAAEMNQGLAWMNRLAEIENGKAKLIFYYAGHGLPDEHSGSPVLVPVDVSAHNLEYAVQLSDAFRKLAEHPAEQVTVFLDACFSGGGREQGLVSRRGIKVKTNKNAILGNMVVFASSSAKETSSVFKEAKHGYFTYHLLKKLKESKGDVDYRELGDYLIEAVRKETGLDGISQTPQLLVSKKVEDSWEDWRLRN